MLVNAYVMNPDGNNGYANVVGNEISAVGYVAGGAALTALAVSQIDATDRAKWDAANKTWTSLATASIDGAIIYDDTVVAPVADPLVCHFEITTNSNGGDYSLNFHADGILYLT
jgi:hypothetical protein